MEDGKAQANAGGAEGHFSEDGRTYHGQGYFAFPMGDEYEGGFKAMADGALVRSGEGVYVTRNDEVYEGVWEDDIMRNVVTIRFQDGSFYRGNVEFPLKYSGFGSYTFSDGSSLYCNFTSNYPRGPVYVNAGDHIWGGHADRSCTYLLPVNRFLPTQTPFTGEDM